MPYGIALQALADPTRRQILERLAEAPSPVGQLAAGLPVSRPAVSQHLKVLKEAGLVTQNRAGTRRVYRVEPQGLAELRDYLDRFWDDVLTAFRTEASSQESPNDDPQSHSFPSGAADQAGTGAAPD